MSSARTSVTFSCTVASNLALVITDVRPDLITAADSGSGRTSVYNVMIKKGKGSHAPAGGCSSPTHGRWARRWINHLSPWRMASATPDLRLPSQPRGITALWPVPNYTAWWQRHMCVNNLPKVITWQCPGAASNLRPWVTSGLQVRHVTIRLPSHT